MRRYGKRQGWFEEKSSLSGGCEWRSAGFLLQKHRSRNRGRVQVWSFSLSLNSKWPRPTNSTINDNGDTYQHHHQWWPLLSLSLPLLFSFLFLYLFIFICLFCLGMAETHCFLIFWFGLLVRFGCKKLMNVCKFGLLSKWV